MTTVAVSKEKLDGLAEAVGSKSETRVPLTIDEMRERVLGLELGIKPSGTKRITSNGMFDVTEYASATVNVRPKLQEKYVTASSENIVSVFSDSGYDGLSEVHIDQIMLEDSYATPDTTEQIVTASSGYDGLSSVTVSPIPNQYIVPKGTLSVDSNGTYDVREKVSVTVLLPFQAKTVSSSFAAQTVAPDASYRALSSVTISAMPYIETENECGGVSVVIG